MIDPAWVALSLQKHIGGKTLRALLRHFRHDVRAILSASPAELRVVPGVGPAIAEGIARIDLTQVERHIARWHKAGVRILPRDTAEYPPALRALDDEPPTLFVLGNWPLNWRSAVAIVGTRQPSLAGRAAAQRLALATAEAGHLIVSGLAYGVDAIAHLGALAVPASQTAAVLGSGVLMVYPPAHNGLAQAICQRGAVLCECAPDMTANAPRLVARNRLITALAEAVVIVETEVDGGAMHAARFARQQGRPLYVVDLPASGNQALLADGARAIDPHHGIMP